MVGGPLSHVIQSNDFNAGITFNCICKAGIEIIALNELYVTRAHPHQVHHRRHQLSVETYMYVEEQCIRNGMVEWQRTTSN